MSHPAPLAPQAPPAHQAQALRRAHPRSSLPVPPTPQPPPPPPPRRNHLPASTTLPHFHSLLPQTQAQVPAPECLSGARPRAQEQVDHLKEMEYLDPYS